VIPIQHQKAGNQVRKDQARRLKWQEAQRIQSKAIKSPGNEYGIKPSEGQLKTFASKLVK